MRPHNSGHWTIDGAVTSQFEQHLRAVLDLPLGSTALRDRYAVMANVLGGDDPDLVRGLPALMARDPGLKIHTTARRSCPGRKVGHVTVVRRRPGRAARPGPARRGFLAGEDDALAEAVRRTRGVRCLNRTAGRAHLGAPSPWSASSWASDSDWPVMEAAAEALAEFGVPVRGGRGLRAPDAAGDDRRTARSAAGRGLRVIIAGAGGAAHLPGMLASVTPLPVIGVPVPLKHLDGMDSLLSIVQMPAGVPVATVSVGGARNAGLLAVRILAAADPDLRARMSDFQRDLEAGAQAKGAALRRRG